MYCIIMAGGTGTRFWPRSRQVRAKQFLSIFQKRTLLQSTISRFRPIIEDSHFYIVANQNQEELVLKQARKIPKENFLFEPVGKNTAPCIGLAAIAVKQKDPQGVMIISPADHQVYHQKKYHEAILSAGHIARTKQGMVTIGIQPNRPATGYGYIQVNGEVSHPGNVTIYHVKTFAEKPNLETAQRFLESGDFLWNSGLFVMRADVYLNALKEHLPELYDGLMEIDKVYGDDQYQETVKRVYKQIKSISVDYGVMEKAKHVYTVHGNFGWNDLGSWEQVYMLGKKDEQGNSISGDVITIDTNNSYVHASKGMIGILGMNDVIVVQEDDAILICPRHRAEDVKIIVEKLKRKQKKNYT